MKMRWRGFDVARSMRRETDVTPENDGGPPAGRRRRAGDGIDGRPGAAAKAHRRYYFRPASRRD